MNIFQYHSSISCTVAFRDVADAKRGVATEGGSVATKREDVPMVFRVLFKGGGFFGGIASLHMGGRIFAEICLSASWYFLILYH